jgi:DNA polymerase (family 10)
VEDHGTPLRKLVAEGAKLTELSGIGKDIARYIEELIQTGSLSMLEELGKQIPLSLIELTRLPGLGAKRARRLWEELDVTTIDGLEAAAQADRIAGLAGFGKKTQDKILDAIVRYRRHQKRFKLSEADQYVTPLLEYVRSIPNVEKAEVAGSYRRRKETVGDIDILVTATDPGPVMEQFTRYPDVGTIERSGDTRGTVILKSGLQVDLRIVPPQSYGAALCYFTGSKEHNVKLRLRAIDYGFRVSEYGVFVEADDDGESGDPWAGQFVAGWNEKDVYESVELAWIPPELREDRGELAAAATGALPDLITVADLRGDLQMHSTWSDGKHSIEQMLEGCVARGYEYFALTDHSKALAMTGGLDAKALRKQWTEIDEIAARHDEIRILRSLEVDILADGSLDLADEMLAQLDVVLVSVHSRFELPLARQTERILKAIQHPAVNVLAHPTGRQINRRDPMQFDLDAVLACAAECGVAMELNAHPDRLDLKDTHLMQARELGVKVVISTDAHRVPELDLIQYGVEQARRAWLDKDAVLNTLPVDALLDEFARTG